MKKKKWIIIVVAVIIVFGIIGASGSNDEKDSKQADNSVTKVENTCLLYTSPSPRDA